MLKTTLKILYDTSNGKNRKITIDSGCSKLVIDYIKHLENRIKEKDYKLKEKLCFEGHSQFKELNKELETYKKIVEKIVKEIDFTYKHDKYCQYKEPFKENKCNVPICIGNKEKDCYQCIIDWARNEVKD